MHYLLNLSKEVDKTHPHLGNLLAFSVLCSKARRCLLIIAPSGCGKSTVMLTLKNQSPAVLWLDSITRNGLKYFEKDITGFNGTVLIDDLGKVDTLYSRISTVTAFAELCYSHFIAKYSMGFDLQISDFNGAAILNTQPPILSQLISGDEWEVVIQDKTVRYYHTFRPTNPLMTLPNVEIDWGIDIDMVKLSGTESKRFQKLCNLGRIQWSQGRSLEHVTALLRACAALDRREVVNASDFSVLERLSAPLWLEQYLIDKLAFEYGRIFKSDFLAILVEFATYGKLTIDTICRDYKVSPQTVVSKLKEIGEQYITIDTESKTLLPSSAMVEILRTGGLTSWRIRSK